MTISDCQRKTVRWTSLVLSAFLALTAGLFLYSANTPLGPCYSSDNSIYMVMGTALANGFRPYLDIFDHKGPLLFVLQWIPQLFGGGFQTITVFIQEVFFLFLCLRMICAITRRFFSIPEWFPQIFYLAYLSSLVGEGNLSEEYCNFFIFVCIYCTLWFFSKPSQPRHRLLICSCIVGACFTVCFLTRANNALPVAGLIVGIFIFLLFSARFPEIGICLVGFISGTLVILIPVFLWLHANNAVEASIQASIFHNLLYSGTTSEYSIGRLRALLYEDYGHAALLFAFFSITGAVTCLFRRQYRGMPLAILLSAGCALIAGFISHKYYDHYLILGIPLAVTGNMLFLSLFKDKIKSRLSVVLLIPCIIWLSSQCYLANQRRLDSNQGQAQFFADARHLSDQIPAQERHRVYPYRVEPKWYVAAHVLPCNRYFFLQETLADANPAVMDEIVESFHSTPPLWLIVYKKDRAFSPPYDSRIQEIIDSQYMEIDSAGSYRLMKYRQTSLGG